MPLTGADALSALATEADDIVAHAWGGRSELSALMYRSARTDSYLHNRLASGFGGPAFQRPMAVPFRTRSRRLRQRGEQVLAPRRPKNSIWHIVHKIRDGCIHPPGLPSC